MAYVLLFAKSIDVRGIGILARRKSWMVFSHSSISGESLSMSLIRVSGGDCHRGFYHGREFFIFVASQCSTSNHAYRRVSVRIDWSAEVCLGSFAFDSLSQAYLFGRVLAQELIDEKGIPDYSRSHFSGPMAPYSRQLSMLPGMELAA
ncbi:hypothetical protein ACKC9G_14790 [Pokkaliibacter sp. CJK22405]|uniref:hypothetical protein n=1 Tax=Pokkaliibacter sp. CJK22405 TaxID=3384615 RepID=UPI0039854B24